MTRVILAIPAGHGLFRQIMRGIRRYSAGRWELPVRVLPQDLSIESVGCPSGIIVLAGSGDLAHALAALPLPVVNVSTRAAATLLPTVGPDNYTAGRIAAQALLDLGFRHLACFSSDSLYHSTRRMEGVRDVAEPCGDSFTALCRTDIPQAQRTIQLGRWLLGLPKPVGLVVTADGYAAELVSRCQAIGLLVPDDVAILGIENDDFFCEMATPSISSIDLGGLRIGMEAARLLESLMQGRPAPDGPILLPPTGLVARQSTAVSTIEDPDVRAAVAYIKAHAGEPITIADVLQQVEVSYQALHRRFTRARGRTIREEILLGQFARAQALLLGTTLSVAEVGRAVGMSNPSHFARAFHAHCGLSPAAYRRQGQGG